MTDHYREDPEPESVPLLHAAEVWGDDIEVQSVYPPNRRWRVRGGACRLISRDGSPWLDILPSSGVMVTLVSCEPCRDDPWATPGEDVIDPRPPTPQEIGEGRVIEP